MERLKRMFQLAVFVTAVVLVIVPHNSVYSQDSSNELERKVNEKMAEAARVCPPERVGEIKRDVSVCAEESGCDETKCKGDSADPFGGAFGCIAECIAETVTRCISVIDQAIAGCGKQEKHDLDVLRVRSKRLILKRVDGDVTLQQPGKAQTNARVGDELEVGSELFAGFLSHAVVVDENGTIIVIDANTQLEHLPPADPNKLRMRLKSGQIRLEVPRIIGPARPDVRIEAPTLTASVRGTDIIVSVAKDGETTVLVNKGNVDVSHANSPVRSVPAGQKVKASKIALGETVALTGEERAKFAQNTDTYRKSPRNPVLALGITALIVFGILVLVLRRRRL